MRRVIILLLIAGIASSVDVSGDIYEKGSLEKLDNVVVTLKGEDYSYRQVFSDSSYSFSLPEGRYELVVERYDGNAMTHRFNETVSLNGKGARIDFVLEPVPAPVDLRMYAIAGAAIIVILIFIHRFLLRHLPSETHDPKPGTQNPRQEIRNPEPNTPDTRHMTQDDQPVSKTQLDEDARKALEAVEAHEGRMTQKELRELLNYSDAKMSLIIAELEHYGLVRKFKRGRGNIIKRIKKD